MQPLELIDKYYSKHDLAKSILIAHSRSVADYALKIAANVAEKEPVDRAFIEEAALLHDIGMIFTLTPKFGCHGVKPYITHGIIGAKMLRNEGLSRHALVCERHIGVGLSVEDIQNQSLPLPLRDMRPQCLEEEIIAYADLFFSKSKVGKRSVEKVQESLARHGIHKVKIFNAWHTRFAL